MRIPKIIKISVVVFSGLVITLLLMFACLPGMSQLSNDAHDIVFATFLFSFLSGMWSMIIFDSWERVS